ncbi:autotransporter outer membrane beta-barrel domain-containing protein [Campylobacter avium]|uniref:autotransporter outer membrane beta-barrel domain-containing protein n=1 Tax=Campylobacter avium TaxID=522485 RepID=UPI000B9A2499|nr:autotransporter outer membrane beta-barrel domain-containing protein [Campylobacter avium]
MQDERKTYQGNLIHHNMLGRIANNLNKPKYAFNTKSKFASLASYYKPYYVNLEEQESDNFYISALAGYSNYKSSSGSEFGLSFGYDKEIEDEFFAGFYASISKSYINTEGMNLDGFNYSLGLYSRVYMPYSLELDVLGYYANNHNKYDRIFAGLSLHQGDYKRHNIGAQARLGYRFEFKNEHSLKPYLGILGSYYHMPSYKENGILPISRSTNTFTSLYGVLGIEYRKILDSGSFFISLEGVNGKAVFGDKNYEMSIGQEKISYENEKELFANVFAGASFSVSKHLDFTASVMPQAYEGGFINVNGGL